MELAFSLLAVIVACIALGLAIGVRNQLAQLPRGDSAVAEVERLRQELGDIRRDLEQAQGELEELKTATQIPAPPLPRARSTGLTDLREQLRAAHREPDPESEE